MERSAEASNMEQNGGIAEPAAKNPRGRPRGNARERILASARVLLAQQRYDAVSVPEIVALAGVAQGTFYRYFGAKGDLVGAIAHEVEEAVEKRIAAVFAEDLPTMKTLPLLFEAGADVCREYADILPFLGFDGLLFGPSTKAETLRQPYLDLLGALIERDQETGQLRASIVPEHAARLTSAILDQVARDLSRNQDAKNANRFKSDALLFLKNALSIR